MSRRIAPLLILLALVFPRAALAQAAYCPQSIAVDQKISQAPAGWSAGDDHSESLLAGVTFFSGPPSQNASLKYDSWTVRRGMAYAVWRFEPDAPEGVWLMCRYASTRVVLSKKLVANTSECTVTYDSKVEIAGQPEIRKIACH